MKPNQDLEDPGAEYVPRLDEMARVANIVLPEGGAEDWSGEDYQAHHERMDQMVRDEQPTPEKRHCYNCNRWVSLGLTEEESEDPRCAKCEWQWCVCGACGCNYKGAVKK